MERAKEILLGSWATNSKNVLLAYLSATADLNCWSRSLDVRDMDVMDLMFVVTGILLSKGEIQNVRR